MEHFKHPKSKEQQQQKKKKNETHKNEDEMRHTHTHCEATNSAAVIRFTTIAIESQSLRYAIDKDRLSECFQAKSK